MPNFHHLQHSKRRSLRRKASGEDILPDSHLNPVQRQVLTLQRTVGNAAVNRMIDAGTLQREEAEPEGVTLEGFGRAAIAGMNQLGARATAENLELSEQNGMKRFTVRLGHHDNEVLPGMSAINERIKAGEVAPGSLSGAPNLLFGALQQVFGQTRVTVRITHTETAEVLAAGKGDADGMDEAAVQKALVSALKQLGKLWKKHKPTS
jgi:hypothetical protein